MSSYNVQNVNVIINYSGGQAYLVGFQNGSTIKAARDSDSVSKHVGLKGDVGWAETNDNSGKITFSLEHTSPSNKLLYRLESSREEFQCSVVDANDDGKSKVSSSNCMITKPADYSRGSDFQAQEWTIYCPQLKIAYD